MKKAKLKLVPRRKLDQQQILEVIDDLRRRAKRGEIRGLIAAFLTTDACSASRTSAGLDYVEKLGLIELAKADLIAFAEGRTP
jgi:hypothetical protein